MNQSNRADAGCLSKRCLNWIILYMHFSSLPEFQVGFAVCLILQGGALYTMNSMARCRRNEKGQVVDAGLDLNQPEAFGE